MNQCHRGFMLPVRLAENHLAEHMTKIIIELLLLSVPIL